MGRRREFADKRSELVISLHAALFGDEAKQTLLKPSMDTYVIEYEDARHYYKIDSEDVNSVTQVLDTIPKPALMWWGFRVGLAGAIKLVQDRQISYAQLQSWAWEPVMRPRDWPGHDEFTEGPSGKERHAIEAIALDNKHSPNHIKEEKGTRGTSIHKAAEKLGDEGEVPDIGDFPEADRGYVQALARYFVQTEVQAGAQEVIVGSKRFGFAGRFDKVAVLPDGTRRLRDYKTSGGVYPEYDVQLSGYWIAYHEMGLQDRPEEGFGPLTGADVVWLQPNGDFEVIPVTIEPVDFLLELLVWHQRRDRDDRVKALGRKP